ncbi:MAG TPA: glycosyltransferase family 2 protein [Terracidiphilus sp.]|nr:glycosyltransferase family 2 protein [Terracidiphilus sp.]
MEPSDEARQQSPLRQIAVLIPAWKPDERLVELVQALAAADFAAIVVVDDGSGEEYERIFARVRGIPSAVVRRHEQNRGQGCAVKTAAEWVLANLPGVTGAVTADADGQHAVADIVRVAEALARSGGRTVLGAREFGDGVPLRSRFGNILTRYVFRFFSGLAIGDTQSGLRGIPRQWLPEVPRAPGDRFEFAIGFLAHFAQIGAAPATIPIATIYIDGNRSSHFKPVRDSVRIYLLLLRCFAASWLPECIDLAGFAAAWAAGRNMAAAMVAGRLAGVASLAFSLRFARYPRGEAKTSFVRRVVYLAATGLVAFAAIEALTADLDWSTMGAKIVVELILYLALGFMKKL